MSDLNIQKDIYTYEAPWLIYGLSWSMRLDTPFRLALGSFTEDCENQISVIKLNEDTGEFECVSEWEHSYPATKLMWMPSENTQTPDLLATSGDYLRLWQIDGTNVSVLNNNKNSEYCAPLTSFDWNESNPEIIGTSSIDTTCTIWNITTQQCITQLIAHDKEVYDIAFANEPDVFASVGADGSVRMFDLRSLDHSTIIYETPDERPLLRLAWNKQDAYYLATFMMDDPNVTILDIRMPLSPAAVLEAHAAPLTSIAWAPHSTKHICTAGDDKQALIWDLSPIPKKVKGPLLAYRAEAEVNQLQWSASQPNWVSIAFGNTLQILKV